MNQSVDIRKTMAAASATTTTGMVAELGALLDGQTTLAAARGISRAALDSLYGIARDLYNCGHRDEALGGLTLLCLYDHENARYWQALGTCRQSKKDHLGAAAAFAFAIGQSGDFDGNLEMQLIESLVAAGHADAAGIRLQAALEAAGQELASEPWHARAGRLQALLKEGAPAR